MKKVIDCIERLVAAYSYKKLPGELSTKCKEFFAKNLPYELKLDGEMLPLFSNSGTMISRGYNRIVVGDYGAFVEMTEDLICKDNLCIESGQEYRLTEKYINNVKYIWLTTKDNSHVKIYKQLRKVSYADYKPDMYYVSPYEIKAVDFE